jgi:hypothetical protein
MYVNLLPLNVYQRTFPHSYLPKTHIPGAQPAAGPREDHLRVRVHPGVSQVRNSYSYL